MDQGSPFPPPPGHNMQRIRRRLDLDQLKMPLGFLRLIELLFVMIALAAVGGWEFELSFQCEVKNNKTLNYTHQYSHSELDISTYTIQKCDRNTTVPLFPDASVGIGPGLFSFLTTATLIFTVATVLFYVLNYAAYASDNRFPTTDLIVTTVLAFGWLFGTLAFSIGVGRIEDATAKENVLKLLDGMDLCKGVPDCKVGFRTAYPMYAPLSVAVLAGCGLVLLFFASIWFCYKETGAFRDRQSRNHMLHQMNQEPYTLE